jgi:2-polyprenyl-3-methyl-5-hydroxy-6-metoxy-1,4-benzoquinol methylase
MSGPGAQAELSCRICRSSTTEALGGVHGSYSRRDYQLRRCPSCRYAFIADPWTEFDKIYDDRYYAGEGADPLVDYLFELEHPDRTVRRYEWRGVTRIVERLMGGLAGIRWLDFGCGNGGLVRHLSEHSGATACGYDEGAITAAAAAVGVPIVSRESLVGQTFDVVTAIEVLEHTLDPLAELRTIRKLLRPGGLLYLTTGNAAPFAPKLTEWSYIVPEIHISFFEPGTLEYALAEAGFSTGRIALYGGFDEIIKFKLLKNLRVRRAGPLTDVIPMRPLAKLIDRRFELSRHPVGWAR